MNNDELRSQIQKVQEGNLVAFEAVYNDLKTPIYTSGKKSNWNARR